MSAIKIALIQSAKPFADDLPDPQWRSQWDDKRMVAAANAKMEQVAAMIDRSGEDGANMAVTTEALNWSVNTWDDRYRIIDYCADVPGELTDRFAAVARRRDMYICVGLFTRRDGKAYNSAVLIGPDGQIVGVFDKVHLPSGEGPGISAGSGYPVFETRHGPVAMLICWDLHYPEAARACAIGGAKLIVVPTWGAMEILNRCRAYENQIPIAVARRTAVDGLGDQGCPSMLVSGTGEIIAVATRDPDVFVIGEVDLDAPPRPQEWEEKLSGSTSKREIVFRQRRTDTYGVLLDNRSPETSVD